MKLILVSVILSFLFVLINGQIYQPKHTVNKKYYLMTLAATNWYKAFAHCRHLGMNLVSISSKEENDRILHQIDREGHNDKAFWTSGTKLGNGEVYYWMGIGEVVRYSNWSENQPDNHDWHNGEPEACLQIWPLGGANRWNDHLCSRLEYFICEQEIIEYEYCLS